jgi:hypothetical protein
LTRVLLDEGVPKTLARALREVGVDATAFPNEWKQLSNGDLLDEIERRGYRVLITNDKRMSYQQNIEHRTLSVLVLPTNRRLDVLPLVPQIASALAKIKPKQFVELVRDAHGKPPFVRRP